MKQFIGFSIIILAIPLLIAVQGQIVTELEEVSSFTEQFTASIELTPPVYDSPIIMKDQSGNIFSEEYIEWRTETPLSEIPSFVHHLFLDSEDNQFYTHRGYDVAAIARAFIVNTSSDNLQQGGSTITQQLIRMRFLSTEKTYERKLTELFYAAELEKQTSKNEILEMYLNEMYFGNKVYGIGAAATYYFSRPLTQLNEAEIAFIAAIPNNPTLYNPIVNFDSTKNRQERLLDTLVKNNRITQDEAMTYKNMPIELALKTKISQFPSYSTYVLSELEELISYSDGYSKRLANTNDPDSRDAIIAQLKNHVANVLGSGIIIETAQDPSKQQQDERELTFLLKPKALQAGAVVIDNSTREIVSIYGGKDYQKANFNRAYQAVRQPGSAIKPLLVYAPLFESGHYSEYTPVNSGPICIGSYCPKNVGGHVYGMTSIQEAFRHSHNTAAVRLFEMTGIEKSFSFIEPFNFKSISENDMNYAAALGGLSRGVTPLELAGAFTGFIDGKYQPVHAIRAVKDRDGNILYEWDNKKIEVWSPTTVKSIRGMMKDVVLNGTGRGVPFTTSYTGLKTGTTDDHKDLWTAGMNDKYTTAVWIGYDKPESMRRLSVEKIHLKAFSVLLKQ